MTGLFIILGVTLSIIVIVKLIKSLIKKSRIDESADWKVGDTIHMLNGREYPLVAWSLKAIYVKNKDDETCEIEWSSINCNESAKWRRKYNECKTFMKSDPGFSTSTSTSTFKVDGKSIELLNETECQVYLKDALISENFELAEKLRKQMEKFR